MGLNNMTIEADRVELLDILRKNRETHRRIVEEARAGYIDKAKAALAKRMKQLEEGKLTSLMFSLQRPEDHTREYDTAIKMLEMHRGDTISLTASQVQCFVQDEWSWKSHFIGIARNYSQTANALVDEEDAPRNF